MVKWTFSFNYAKPNRKPEDNWCESNRNFAIFLLLLFRKILTLVWSDEKKKCRYDEESCRCHCECQRETGCYGMRHLNSIWTQAHLSPASLYAPIMLSPPRTLTVSLGRKLGGRWLSWKGFGLMFIQPFTSFPRYLSPSISFWLFNLKPIIYCGLLLAKKS